MPDSSGSTRLQRLQRQRQRANRQKTATRTVTPQQVVRPTPTPVLSPASGGGLQQAVPRNAVTNGSSSGRGMHSSWFTADDANAPPSLGNEGTAAQASKLRASIGSAVQNDRQTAERSRRRIVAGPQDPVGPSSVEEDGNEGIEVLAGQFLTSSNTNTNQLERRRHPETRAEKTKPGQPGMESPVVLSASPKSKAVSKSIANARHFARYGAAESRKTLGGEFQQKQQSERETTKASSQESQEWFRYTTGTQHGRVTPKISNESPKLEKFDVKSQADDTPLRKNGSGGLHFENDAVVATLGTKTSGKKIAAQSKLPDARSSASPAFPLDERDSSTILNSPIQHNPWKEMSRVVKTPNEKTTSMAKSFGGSIHKRTPSPAPKTKDAGSMPDLKKTDSWPTNTPQAKASKPKKVVAKRMETTSNSTRHGGIPVWIDRRILVDDSKDEAWQWSRGHLQAGGEPGEMLIVVDDEQSNLNGQRYSLPRSYNDGEHVLMGNSWWTASSSASPTSVSSQLGRSDIKPGDGDGMPPSDLVELTHLHEPAIVHALRCRYKRDLIYTNTGSILLAINPFKKLDHLYTREVMESFWNDGGSGKDLPPHVYAVAERSYSNMIKSLEHRDAIEGELIQPRTSSDAEDSPICNQSILVSGESGSGKTVTTKIILRYLSVLSLRGFSGPHRQEDAPTVEMQVLQSNPILESFGNARTVRNDNSSRFGKFIELVFAARTGLSQRGALLGANIDFYLLEKVRLVSVSSGERNFHIFYEILSSGMPTKDKRRYKLTANFGIGRAACNAQDFKMTSMSGTFDRRDGVCDDSTYNHLRTAMSTVGFSLREQDEIYSIASALLHSSNLELASRDSDQCTICERDGTLTAVANLLGVTVDALKMSVTASVIEARGERLMKRNNTEQASKALEALSMAIYGALFAYIVRRINASIQIDQDRTERGFATIGILDIFGFESFERNSFEQLCINYCNEALQQQFNRFVLKSEQAEYEYEGIQWSNITFTDNQETLDLIEARRDGIFSVLDEQCRLPKRTDRTFASSVYDTCVGNNYFVASRMQQSANTFSIKHYAGDVEYNVEFFLQKNKDELPKSAVELLSSSTVSVVAELANILGGGDASSPPQESEKRAAAAANRSSNRVTVSAQFASQLQGLRSRIATTEPHYIRCLKPNDRLVANLLDDSLLSHQLNCAGVLPAMKIARSGFSMRYQHGAFIRRYRPIVGRHLNLSSSRCLYESATCRKMISDLRGNLRAEISRRQSGKEQPEKESDDDDVISWSIQVGKTKVFLRSAAFDALEELLDSTRRLAATRLQAETRAYLGRNRFLLMLGSILTVQCSLRKMVATRKVRELRLLAKSVVIQRCWRQYAAWSRFQNTLFLAFWCQRLWRGKAVRTAWSEIIRRRSAITIQSSWRSRIFRRHHLQARSFIILIQCYVRRFLARCRLRILKRDAKDVACIAMERDKLRAQMNQFRRQIEILTSPRSRESNDSSHEESLIRHLSEECAKKDSELQVLRREVDSLRGSGSVPSTLPRTVTIDGSSAVRHASPSLGIRFHQAFVGLTSNRSNSLLDAEPEGPPELECSQISIPDSVSEKIGSGDSSFYNHTIESSLNDCLKIEELPFHEAVLNDDMERLLNEIQSATELELAINSLDSKMRTPLHIAVQCGSIEIAKILLTNDAVAVNAQDQMGNTPLHYVHEATMTLLLLEGGVNANIPNSSGLCVLHLAVKRGDFESVKHLLRHGANVNYADDEYWYTPLHLVAQGTSSSADAPSFRGPIAQTLCETHADMNYQDREGNTPLHHAASLIEEDAGLLISIFIDHGSRPSIPNIRGQTPLHLFCHNQAARRHAFYHEALHLMLVNGADPNQVSLSGCTAIHLALFHQDVDAAVLLVRNGAQINQSWRKPKSWQATWTDMGTEDILPLDMVEDVAMLSRILCEISSPQARAPKRIRCMHCKGKLGMFARNQNCSHCGRSICGRCCAGTLPASFCPHIQNEDGKGNMCRVCILCKPIIFSRVNNAGVPTTIMSSYNACDQSSIGTLSL